MRFLPRLSTRTPASKAGTVRTRALSRGKLPLKLLEWGLVGSVMVFPELHDVSGMCRDNQWLEEEEFAAHECFHSGCSYCLPLVLCALRCGETRVAAGEARAAGGSPAPERPGRARGTCSHGIPCVRDHGQQGRPELPCPGSRPCPPAAEPGPPIYCPADKPHPCHQQGWVGCKGALSPPLPPSLLTISLVCARRTTMSTTPPWPAARPTRPESRGSDRAWCTWCRCEPAPWLATASTAARCASRH